MTNAKEKKRLINKTLPMYIQNQNQYPLLCSLKSYPSQFKEIETRVRSLKTKFKIQDGPLITN